MAALKPKPEIKVDFQDQFQVGSLVSITDLSDISKQTLTDRVKQFSTPAYVDLKGS